MDCKLQPTKLLADFVFIYHSKSYIATPLEITNMTSFFKKNINTVISTRTLCKLVAQHFNL